MKLNQVFDNESEDAYFNSPDDTSAVQENNQEQEIDPLDSYMLSLAESLKKETKKPKTEERFDADDTVADMMEAISSYHKERENTVEEDENENSNLANKNNLIPEVDHSKINYYDFKKDLYKENESLAALSLEEKTELKAASKIQVTGFRVPQPIRTFADLKQTLHQKLLTNIQNLYWLKPTPIQSQLIPVALSGRDTFATAETGSGKTGAYLIPLIEHVCHILNDLRMMQMPKHRGPIGLILCPTRELATQIYDVATQLTANLKLRVSCFSGGYDKTKQFKEIVAGIEICIGNPGRIIDLVCMNGGLKLEDTALLILDEVDRLLSMGFYAQVTSICSALRPDKQTVVVTATVPTEVVFFIDAILKKPVKITIGTESQAAASVKQRPVVFPDEQKKAEWLLNNITKMLRWERQILIFCKSYGRTLDLTAVLNSFLQENEDSEAAVASATATQAAARLASEKDLSSAQPCTISAPPTQNVQKPRKAYAQHLFGNMSQAERHQVISSFRKKKFDILVASDVASRGLDLPDIAIVINYDMAQKFETHVHRIGRTGRMGQEGIAYSFLTRKDNKIAGFIVEEMQAANQEVPKQLMQLALTFEPYKTAQQTGVSYIEFMKSRKKGKQKKNPSKMNTANEPKFTFQKNEPEAMPTAPAPKKSRFSSAQTSSHFSAETVNGKVFSIDDEISSSSEDMEEQEPPTSVTTSEFSTKKGSRWS